MLRNTSVFQALQRFTAWSAKTKARTTKDERKGLLGKIHHREASILQHSAQRRDMKQHNQTHQSYSRKLDRSFQAIAMDGNARTPEKFELMRNILQLKEAAKMEARTSRSFEKTRSRHKISRHPLEGVPF